MSCSNDSSSESENEMLREALDPSMFLEQYVNTSLEKKKHGSYKDNILNVSPEFQNFVAQRLSKVIEKSLEECENKLPVFELDGNSGIKLFSDSIRVLKDKKFRDIFDMNSDGVDEMKSRKRGTKVKKRRIQPSIDDESYETEILEKAKSTAVSVDWILNKEGVKEWNKPKGSELMYKRNSHGQLELVELLNV